MECSGCGRKFAKAYDSKERAVRDLPWSEFRVTVHIEVYRVNCPECGLKVEKVPLLLSALAVIGAVLYSTRAIAPALDGGSVPFTERIANALVSYGAYLLKMLWPAHLGIYYPPRPQTPVVEVAAAVFFLTGITLVAVRYRRSRPWLLTGWLWYLGALVPVIGLVRSGHWPAMADRYAYLPLTGIFIALAWSVPDPVGSRRRTRAAAAAASGTAPPPAGRASGAPA